MGKRMPWEAPDIASLTPDEIQKEKEKADAHGATIEGGCWFSHVGGIDAMEKSYGRRSRERDQPSDAQPAKVPLPKAKP